MRASPLYYCYYATTAIALIYNNYYCPLLSFISIIRVNAFIPSSSSNVVNSVSRSRSTIITKTTTTTPTSPSSSSLLFGVLRQSVSNGIINSRNFQNRRVLQLALADDDGDNALEDTDSAGREAYVQTKDTGVRMVEGKTGEEHLVYQRRVFDEKADFFNSLEAVEKVVPILRHLGERVVRQVVQSRVDGGGGGGDATEEEYKILDVACGTGALFPYYLQAADKLGIRLSIVGLDLSPKMISMAKTNAEKLLLGLPGNGTTHSFQFVLGDFVQTILGVGYETDYEDRDTMRAGCLIGSGDGVEDELTKDHRGVYDAVVFNACFGNFYDQVATTTAACQSLKPNGIFTISHPLGANFVRQLSAEDPNMVPHHLPTDFDFRRLTRTQPLNAYDIIEEVDLHDCDKNVQSYPLYYASASRVPHRPTRDVMRFRGVVDRGYGRGGKKLGFPTANLQSSPSIRTALNDVPMGVYFGWAVIEDSSHECGSSGADICKVGRNVCHKAVVNVGFSPTFDGEENREKIIEAHLILDDVENDIKGDFYNETMRLALSGFLRYEKKFPSFPELIQAINRDVSNARDALGMQPFLALRSDTFLAEPCKRIDNRMVDDGDVWVGTSGGDKYSSYEFQYLEDAISDIPMG